jgi:hypothetical protein
VRMEESQHCRMRNHTHGWQGISEAREREKGRGLLNDEYGYRPPHDAHTIWGTGTVDVDHAQWG